MTGHNKAMLRHFLCILDINGITADLLNPANCGRLTVVTGFAVFIKMKTIKKDKKLMSRRTEQSTKFIHRFHEQQNLENMITEDINKVLQDNLEGINVGVKVSEEGI